MGAEQSPRNRAAIPRGDSTEPQAADATILEGPTRSSTEEVLAVLQRTRLLPERQLAKLADTLAAQPTASATEVLSQLVQQGVLTEFQSQELLAGRGDRLVLGRYALLDRLGQGGMGVVYRGLDLTMERPVAIKVLLDEIARDEQRRRRFRQEVVAAARLTHPNIVQAYDAELSDGAFYLVMELVDGDDLAAHCQRHGALPVEDALRAVRAAAEGLQYAHQRGLVHRDVKPSNLLRAKDGTIKLLDLGLARIAALDPGDGTQEALTSDGVVMGTVDYLSPEQAEDPRRADARSDIYSLGMTLYWLLARRPAYAGLSLPAKLLAHRQTPVPALTSVGVATAEVDALIARMCAKRPADRFQSMQAVVSAIDTILQHQQSGTVEYRPAAATRATSTSPPDGANVGPVSWASRVWRPRLGLATVAVATLLVATVLAWRGQGGPRAMDASTVTPRGVVPTAVEQPATSGVVERALLFNGRGQHVRTPIRADGKTPLTIEAWVILLVDSVSPKTIVSNTEEAGFKLEMHRDVPGHVCFTSYEEQVQGKIRVPSDRPLPIARRVHLAGVWQQESLRLFVDGQLQQTGKIIKRHRASPLEFLIGANPTYIEGRSRSVGDYGFPGVIDEVRFSGVARYGDEDFVPPERFESDPQTLALYHCDELADGQLLDSSPNQKHAKVVGAQLIDRAAEAQLLEAARRQNSPAANPYPGPARGWDLSRHRATLDCPLDDRQPYTVEAWIKPTASNEAYASRPLIVVDRFVDLTTSWQPPYCWLAGLRSPVEGQAIGTGWGHPVTPGQIRHLAAVYDGEFLALYEQGVYQGARRVPASLTREPKEPQSTVIGGGYPVGEQPFPAELLAVRVSQTARYQGPLFEPASNWTVDGPTLLLLRVDADDPDRLVVEQSAGGSLQFASFPR